MDLIPSSEKSVVDKQIVAETEQEGRLLGSAAAIGDELKGDFDISEFNMEPRTLTPEETLKAAKALVRMELFIDSQIPTPTRRGIPDFNVGLRRTIDLIEDKSLVRTCIVKLEEEASSLLDQAYRETVMFPELVRSGRKPIKAY